MRWVGLKNFQFFGMLVEMSLIDLTNGLNKFESSWRWIDPKFTNNNTLLVFLQFFIKSFHYF